MKWGLARRPCVFDIIEETVIRITFEFGEENQVQTANVLDISRRA